VVGKRHLARARVQAAADERRHRGRMMRRAEGPPVRQGAVRELARDRLDHRDLEQLARRERRQDRGQPLRQHRLAGARRAAHQQVVAPGRGDLQGALRALLALDVLQIRQAVVEGRDGGLRPRHDLYAFEVVRELDQRARREHLDVAGRPGGLGAAGIGADEPVPALVRGDRRRQHARDRGDRAVERKLAQDREALERIGRDRADRRHHAERDRQIVMRALLGQIGRREVHGDALRRQREAGGDQRRAHPLARFPHRLVRQADDREHHVAGRELHLHVDEARLDPLESDRRDARDHAGTLRNRAELSLGSTREQVGNRCLAGRKGSHSGATAGPSRWARQS
jgi:hypothetical protein